MDVTKDGSWPVLLAFISASSDTFKIIPPLTLPRFSPMLTTIDMHLSTFDTDLRPAL